MGIFKAAIKAVKGDMLGATAEMLPDAIKDQGKEVIQETAADYLETKDIRGVGQRMFNNTLTRLAGNAKSSQANVGAKALDTQSSESFMVYKNNEQYGPFTANEMKQLVDGNEINKDTLVWREGMEEWQPVNQVMPLLFMPPAPSMPPVPSASMMPPVPLVSPVPPIPQVQYDSNHVDIPEGIEYLDENFEIDDIVSSISLPSTLKKLDSEVFCEKTKLRIIDFSKVTKLKTIPEYCFMGCKSLEEIIIPEGVLKVEYGAFEDCTNLRRIVLPSTLNKMSSLVEEGGLINLVCVDFSKVTQLKIIPEYCFMGCKSLEEIIIPEGVLEVEYGAFEGCTNLKRIILPSTLKDKNNITITS